MTLSNKDTLCVHTFASPNVNFSRNEHRMCCHTKGYPITSAVINRQGPELFFQLAPLVQAKKDALMGIRPSACSYCWKIEDAGGVSPRSTHKEFVAYIAKTNWFKTQDHSEIRHKLDTLTEQGADHLARFLDHPTVLEIALTNTCDLKCMYCSPHFSTQWATELIKYGEIRASDISTPSSDFQSVFWKYFLDSGFKHTEYISFIGGEPLIINEFYTNLEIILANYDSHVNQDELPSQININVITNLNCQEKYFNKLLDLIPKILRNPRLRFRIGVSFESVTAKSEFIRTGTDWCRFDRNLNRLYEHVSMLPDSQKSRVELGCHVTINSLAVSGLPEFFTYIVGIRNKYGIHVRLYRNQVVWPGWMSPGVLSSDFAHYIDKSIQILETNLDNCIDVNSSGSWYAYCEFLKGIKVLILSDHSDMDAICKFSSEIDKMCTRRNLNFHKTFPEMVHFYNSIKQH